MVTDVRRIQGSVCCQCRVAVGSHQHWIGSIFSRGEEVKSAVSLKDPGYQIVDPNNASTDKVATSLQGKRRIETLLYLSFFVWAVVEEMDGMSSRH